MTHLDEPIVPEVIDPQAVPRETVLSRRAAARQRREDLEAAGQIAKFTRGRHRVEGKLRREARIFAMRLVRDVAYRRRLLDDLRAGTLDPSLERMLWDRAYGKVPTTETLSIETSSGDAPQQVTVIKRMVVKAR